MSRTNKNKKLPLSGSETRYTQRLWGRTVGIGNTNILSSNANVSDNDFLKIDGTSVEGRTAAEVRADLSLNNDVYLLFY